MLVATVIPGRHRQAVPTVGKRLQRVTASRTSSRKQCEQLRAEQQKQRSRQRTLPPPEWRAVPRCHHPSGSRLRSRRRRRLLPPPRRRHSRRSPRPSYPHPGLPGRPMRLRSIRPRHRADSLLPRRRRLRPRQPGPSRRPRRNLYGPIGATPSLTPRLGRVRRHHSLLPRPGLHPRSPHRLSR
jgi:hypothetical protein